MNSYSRRTLGGLVLLLTILLAACQTVMASNDNRTSPAVNRAFSPTDPFVIPPVNTIPNRELANIPQAVPIRALRIDYPDLGNSRELAALLEERSKAAGINLIALGAGRVEWTYFKWAGHENVWANDVKDTQVDYLMEDALRFRKFAHVNAVVDIFAPHYILEHPDQAAINWLGVPSEFLVGTMDLVDGEFGQMVLDMIEAIAANYPVDSISITELFYHSDGYGPKEKAAYMAYTGQADWPRFENGLINIDDKSIGDWRGYELDRWLDRAVLIAHKYGKQLFMDVALSLDDLTKMTNEHGTNYDLVLQHMDKLVIWAYLDLDNYPPEYLFDIARFLLRFESDRIILSIGLWSDQTTVITADILRTAILSSQEGGMPNIWITPSSLMQDGHWQTLDELWGLPFQLELPLIIK